MTIAKNDENFGSILICAVRYAMGRKTYMPSVVVDFIKPFVRNLDSKTLTVIADDIKSADDENRLGDPTIDAPVWRSLRGACLDELQKRYAYKTQLVNTIAGRVRHARKKKGLTQLCLAMRCDMCYQSSISKIERGERTPTMPTIERLAKELGVTAEWLLNGEGNA